jgi:predicted short-subunit dehydrogenase-like oxidoreductase (DUF2520 family)
MRELEREKDSTNTVPSLVLVGAGRVGHALARAGVDAGLELHLAGREEALAACRRSEAALLCVPDTVIADACASLASAVPPLRFVGHTSGATGLGALAAAAERGASTFSLHPLQTVPDGEATVAGAPCAVSGSDPAAVALAVELAERFGMRPFEVPETSRAAYHAAASLASNLLVALEESAVELLRRAGIEDGRELLAPLVLRTAANWAERGPGALTGPIARGDEQTVERHIEALTETAPQLLELYGVLAERARSVAGREVPA